MQYVLMETIAKHHGLLGVPKVYIDQCQRKAYSQELLNYCSSLQQVKLTNRDKLNPHGEKVVSLFADEGKLDEFIKMWRQHFLANNDTKYLPKGWRVDHKLERNFGHSSVFAKNTMKTCLDKMD